MELSNKNNTKLSYITGSIWYVKIDPSQNIDQSTSLERSYKELLNACFSFEIRHSELKLWTINERPQNKQKISLDHGRLWYIKINLPLN